MRLTGLFAASAVTAIVLAQPIAPSEPEWVHFGDNNDVRALCRVGDSLWVGTSGGLFIYDLGSDEIKAHVTLGQELPSNSVRAISANRTGVYVGTDDGLAVFTNDTVSVFTDRAPGVYAGSPFGLIRRIDFGLDDVVYLSTYGSGLGVLDGDKAWVITREDSLLDDKVYGMVQEDDTTYYFATSMGLCAYRDSLWVNFQAGAGIPRAEIRQIEAAPEGGYYLLIQGRGVYWFDGFRARRVAYPALFPENAVASIAVDSWGSLWACGEHGAIAVYRNGHWTRVDEAGSGSVVAAGRRWRCAYADTLGAVYFGSSDGRVLSIRDNIVGEFQLPAELPSNGVGDIVADSSGTVFVLNGSYLVRIDRDPETISIEHPSPIVVAFTVSPGGELWTATRWGIYRRDGGRYVGFPADLSERNPVLSAIGFDTSGSLWVGTESGNVHRYDGELWMRLGDPDELDIGPICGFDSDARGRLWATGSAGGVAAYQGGRWTMFTSAAFDDQSAQALAVAPNGQPVVATRSGLWGLSETGEWVSVHVYKRNEDNDLYDAGPLWDASNPPITSLGFDPAGRLYVGTDNGLVCIDDSGSRLWTYRDGLGGKSVSCVYVDGQGTLWIGFVSDGLTCVPLTELW